MKFIDLTKEPPFGLLTVIAHSHCGRDQKHYWKCRCQCGKEKVIRGNYLTDGRVVSCGCKKKRKGHDHPGWKGCGDLSGEFLYNIRAGAKRRKLQFELSNEDLWNLYLKQGKRCALTGIPLSLEGDSEEVRYVSTTKRTASLDRKDSSKGYEKGNVQWIHKTINLMKLDLSESEFIKWCRSVAEHTRQ